MISVLEITATVSGFLGAFLAVRANIWNWFFGILTVSLHFFLFFRVKLYADMGLQLIYFGYQFYGLYQWLYGNENKTALTIRNLTPMLLYRVLFINFMLFFLLSFILYYYTDSTTIYIDSFTTAVSLIAQWMMCKKYLENWWSWMLVNIISVDMYINKHLYFTAILFSVLFILCIFGYCTWRKKFLEIKINTQCGAK